MVSSAGHSSGNMYNYLDKYARHGGTWKPLFAPDTVDHARRTLDELRYGHNVSISMLESVVSLPEHPRSLHLLNDHLVIQTCLLRLFRLQRRDPTYPFGHEDGYLLFRIVVLAIGVRIISRIPRKHKTIIQELHENKKHEDRTVMLMEYVAHETGYQITQVKHIPSEPFLGWSSDKMFGDPIITRPNALILLNILWTDRKGFVQAWARTHAPAMAGVFAILWKCVQNASTSHRWAMFCEVLWRYHVAGTENVALVEFNTAARDRVEDWKQISGRVDLEDERMLIQAYVERITSTTTLYPIPDLASVGQMVGFVIPMTGLMPGTEDLFIPVLRATLEYFWLTVAGKTYYTTFRIQSADCAATVLPAYTMLDHLHNHSPNRVHEFVSVSAELGVMEILAKGFVLIKEEKFEEDAVFEGLYQACANFGATLAMVSDAFFRVSTFAPAFPDWYKSIKYMRARDSMFNTRTHRRAWFQRAEWIWGKTVAGYLEYDEEFQGAEALSSG
ncbi:hypothetical protein FRC07_010826, partial [Ceratobasidium sp. 392]